MGRRGQAGQAGIKCEKSRAALFGEREQVPICYLLAAENAAESIQTWIHSRGRQGIQINVLPIPQELRQKGCRFQRGFGNTDHGWIRRKANEPELCQGASGPWFAGSFQPTPGYAVELMVGPGQRNQDVYIQQHWADAVPTLLSHSIKAACRAAGSSRTGGRA